MLIITDKQTDTVVLCRVDSQGNEHLTLQSLHDCLETPLTELDEAEADIGDLNG